MSRKTGYVRMGGGGPLMTKIRFFGPAMCVILFSYTYTPQKIGVFNRGWYAKQCVFYSRREFRSKTVADEQVVPSVWLDVVDR